MSDHFDVFAQLASNQKHERHGNHRETVYWCQQWRLLAEQAVDQLARELAWTAELGTALARLLGDPAQEQP